MEPQILKIVDELNARLSLVLEEFSVKAHVKNQGEGASVIVFTDGANAFCPVEILLHNEPRPDVPGAALTGSMIKADYWYHGVIGANRWTYHQPAEDEETFELEKEGEAVFDEIEQYLREYECVRLGDDPTKYTESEAFVEAYLDVESVVGWQGEIDVSCKRKPTHDCLTFADPGGSDWVIGFIEGMAVISVNGRKVASVSEDRTEEIGNALNAALEDHRREWVRKP